METQNWINEVLNSTNGMMKVIPDDSLYSKIENRIQKQTTIPSQWLWVAAASFTILLSLNIKLILTKLNQSNNQTELLASSISKTNQLY
jgi:bacteriorhodopsin